MLTARTTVSSRRPAARSDAAIVRTATRVVGVTTAVCLLVVTACSSDADDVTSASAPTAATTTAAESSSGDPTTTADDSTEGSTAESSDEPATTEPPVTTTAPTTAPSTAPPSTTEPEADDTPVSTVPDDVPLLDFEFQAVPAGRYRVETIGAPFLIDIPEGWWVQPNSFGHFVITDADSMGPGDRDIVMIRPSNLADPDQPGSPAEEQTGDWPLDDIAGWLEALVPGVVHGEPVDTTIGGLDAVQFDAAIADEVECGDDFCVGFASNRQVNGMWFDRPVSYRVWWIDGGEEAPIAINIGAGSDPAFTERAQAVLATVTFESVGPNPIPSEGNLWELGIPSDVPAGTVFLPIGPGVTFETSERHFVQQREYRAGVFLDDDSGEADIVVTDMAFDGEPLATVDDVAAAFERDPSLTATIVGTRDVGGYEATEINVVGTEPDSDGPPPPSLLWSSLPNEGWRTPPEGTLWAMETPDGIVVITAEWYEPSGMEPARALAAEILDSIVIGS